jgi:hypothetical protein
MFSGSRSQGLCRIAGQNWMLVLGGGLLLYVATLIVARHFQPHAH